MMDPSKASSVRPPSPRRRHRRGCLCLGASLASLLLLLLFLLAPHLRRRSPGAPRFSVVIDAGSSGTRAHVFALAADQRLDLERAAVMRVTPGLSSYAGEPGRAGESLVPLIGFVKERIGEEWVGETEVRLMATAGLRLLEERVQEEILASCRDVLRSSGFRFRDAWAKVIPGSDEGIYAWVAANYALGTLGGDPEKTVGIIELGGASAQLTFVSNEVLPPETSHSLTFGKTTYNLYSNSFLHFGQNAAQESLHELLRSTESSKKGMFVDPCAPKGYSHNDVAKQTTGVSRSKLEIGLVDHGDGNFTKCRSASLMLLQQGKENCQHEQCHLGSTFVPELRGRFLATENFYFTSKFFGLRQASSISDFVLAGEQLCKEDLPTLKKKYPNRTEEDFSRYCFSSAYIVALLHDSLGVPLDDKRIDFSNQVGDIQVEWALGALITSIMASGVDRPNTAAAPAHSNKLLLVLLAALLVCGAWLASKWGKPKVKTIYDLEKGRYIVTRIS